MTTDRQRRLIAFHMAFDVPILHKPQVPADDRVRLRLRLIAEEFFELLAASGIDSYLWDEAETIVYRAIAVGGGWSEDEIDKRAALPVRLPDFADALADLDYVIEGTRLEFGIDGETIEAEVHRSNLSKVGGATREDGKKLKGPNYSPPDVAGVLRRQGWQP